MEITGLPAGEWSGVVEDSKEFWAETAQISPRCAKVVDAFNKYADTMEKQVILTDNFFCLYTLALYVPECSIVLPN